MYRIYLNKILLPVTPAKISMEIKGGNKTVDLINDGEINLIKENRLTEIKFDCLLPQTKYHFAVYKDNKFKSAKYFLDKFESFKNKKKAFQFKITRDRNNSKVLFDTENMDVTLENYTIIEDTKNGIDILVSVTLKQYKDYSTKTIAKKKKKSNSENVSVKANKDSKKSIKNTYTVKKNDCLSVIAKKELNDASKHKFLYDLNKKVIEDAAKKNKRKSSSNGYYIYPGTVLKLKK